MEENNMLVYSGSVLSKRRVKSNQISILKHVLNSAELEPSHLSIDSLQNLSMCPASARLKSKLFLLSLINNAD